MAVPQYTHIAQLVRAGILYIQGQGFKSLCEYYLGVPEWFKGTDCKSDDSWVQIPPPSLRVMCYIDKLIKNNTGVSSKNFFLVAVTVIGLILLLVPAVLLIVEIIYNHTIATDLNGLAAYIGAVAAVFTSAGITKAWSEKYERKDGNVIKQNSSKMAKEK